MTPERLKELLEYFPLTGEVRNRKNKRTLQQDHDGLVVVFCSITKKSTKMKLERVAYALGFGVFPKEHQRVLHRNLDVEDNRLVNLMLVSRAEFLQIKEAHRNLIKDIRIQPHGSDQFDYVISWFEKGIERRKIVHDIIKARQGVLRLQLKYSKILTKYCIFE